MAYPLYECGKTVMKVVGNSYPPLPSGTTWQGKAVTARRRWDVRAIFLGPASRPALLPRVDDELSSERAGGV
jgi:hypothetical protein